MTKKTVITLIKTVLPLLIGAYLIWYFFSSMNADAKKHFYRAINEANYFWIVLSLLIGFSAYLSRAYRWKYVLEPLGHKTKFWNRYHAIMIGYIVNLTIPRAGEASRAGMLYRSDGVPFSTSFGTIIAERAFDLIMLMIIAFITLFLGFNDFFEIKRQIQVNFNDAVAESTFPWKYVIYGIVLLGIFVMGYLFLFKESVRNKFILFGKDVVKGIFSIFKSDRPWSYVTHTFIIWICYMLMFVVAFQSLPETSDFPVSGLFMGFIAGSLGITFTNGGIGTYPLLVGLVVNFYLAGEYPDDALGIGNALGMIIWSTQTLLMIVLGLISLMLLPKNYKKTSHVEE